MFSIYEMDPWVGLVSIIWMSLIFVCQALEWMYLGIKWAYIINSCFKGWAKITKFNAYTVIIQKLDMSTWVCVWNGDNKLDHVLANNSLVFLTERSLLPLITITILGAGLECPVFEWSLYYRICKCLHLLVLSFVVFVWTLGDIRDIREKRMKSEWSICFVNPWWLVGSTNQEIELFSCHNFQFRFLLSITISLPDFFTPNFHFSQFVLQFLNYTIFVH